MTTRILVLLGVLALATVAGLVRRARDGRVRAVAADGRSPVLTALGVVGGERATLVQFSSAFCAPCRATRRVLADVADGLEGVAHVEVDAESHLDLVRELGILKTPTTLVLDRSGAEAFRAVGQPRRDAVLARIPS